MFPGILCVSERNTFLPASVEIVLAIAVLGEGKEAVEGPFVRELCTEGVGVSVLGDIS